MRLMRLRATKHIRDLCADVEFNSSQLIQPLFSVEGLKGTEPVAGLKDNFRMDIDATLKQVERDLESGVRHFILFPVPQDKFKNNFSHKFSDKVISSIKKQFGDQLHLWVDTCLCSYTEHGHCAILNEKNKIDLGSTLKELTKSATHFADAGADGISPSDMMDGRTAAIREALDNAGHDMVPIMSYSTKFSSNFYGPFRNAASSAPQFGDRKTYQIDVRNKNDALQSSLRCAQEGADLLMVKPGMTSVDLISKIQDMTGKQVGAYQVSGEYAGMVLLAENQLIDFKQAILESWYVFKRAGAQYIITYGARYAKELGVKIP